MFQISKKFLVLLELLLQQCWLLLCQLVSIIWWVQWLMLDESFLDVISRGRTHLDLVTLPLIFFLARTRGKNINEEKNQFGCCWFRRRFCNFLNWINHLRMVPPTHSWRTMQKTSRFYHFMISLEYIGDERAWISTNLTLLRLLMVPTVNKYWNLILFFCS